MAHQFDDAAEALEQVLAAGDLDGAESLLREIGKEALSENSDWVMLHRSRPLEVPRGG
jgi:DNA repair protein RadC